MDHSPKCYVPSFLEIGPLAPEKRFFLLNVFFALKGSILLLSFSYHCMWMLYRVAAVKSLPALIYSADNIFLLVLWDHGIDSENSEMIIRLDSFSTQIWNILLFFRLISVFGTTAMLKSHSQLFSSGSFCKILKGHWWDLNSRNRGMAQLPSYKCFL